MIKNAYPKIYAMKKAFVGIDPELEEYLTNASARMKDLLRELERASKI